MLVRPYREPGIWVGQIPMKTVVARARRLCSKEFIAAYSVVRTEAVAPERTRGPSIPLSGR